MENTEQNSEIIIYESDSGQPKIEVRIEGETVWLSQAQLVALFDSSKANVSEHIKHIFDEGELQRGSVVRKFRTTATDSKNYTVEHYNIVSAYFDLAEVKAMNHEPMQMQSWIVQLYRMIETFDKKVLSDAGTISHKEAIKKAEVQYKKYQTQTFSTVERAYLDSITAIEKKVKKKVRSASSKKENNHA